MKHIPGDFDNSDLSRQVITDIIVSIESALENKNLDKRLRQCERRFKRSHGVEIEEIRTANLKKILEKILNLGRGGAISNILKWSIKWKSSHRRRDDV